MDRQTTWSQLKTALCTVVHRAVKIGYISHICREAPRWRIYTKFGTGVRVADGVITWQIFDDRLREGSNLWWQGRKSMVPTDKAVAVNTVLLLPRSKWFYTAPKPGNRCSLCSNTGVFPLRNPVMFNVDRTACSMLEITRTHACTHARTHAHTHTHTLNLATPEGCKAQFNLVH